MTALIYRISISLSYVVVNQLKDLEFRSPTLHGKQMVLMDRIKLHGFLLKLEKPGILRSTTDFWGGSNLWILEDTSDDSA